MTNHPVAKYPTVDTFPKADANASYHDTFLRYKTLTNITSNHKGKFTCQDMIDTLRAVYAETNDQVLIKERALEVNMPERTTTNSLVDVTKGHDFCPVLSEGRPNGSHAGRSKQRLLPVLQLYS
jgi:hypothetical protein